MCGKRLYAETLARVVMGDEVEAATFGRRAYEMTLTMPSDVDEAHGLGRREVWDHEQVAWDKLLKRLRMRLSRLGVKEPLLFFRSREAQPDRGSVAPHFLVYGNLWKGLSLRQRVRVLTDVGYGRSHVWKPVRSLRGFSGYFLKYAMKEAQEKDPRYRIPSGVVRCTYSPDLMPDRASWRAYAWLCWRASEQDKSYGGEGGVTCVVVNGPAGFVRLDRASRWWLTAEWREARAAEWWLRADERPRLVAESWTWEGRLSDYQARPQLRMRMAEPPEPVSDRPMAGAAE